MEFRSEISALYGEMIALRRDFHAHPELGFEETRTSGIIERYLGELGLETRRCASTGVIGVLRGGREGKTILLRADIDALPVEEETGLPFRSQTPGVMHACGHDGHISMLLIAAKILAARREELAGTVVFLFQPNEEDAGAEKMIEDGALENPVPDAVCGLHLWSPLPTGTIGVVPGPIMASSYYFKLTITGRGGHGGAPHKAINPLNAAAQVLEAVNSFLAQERDPLAPTVISVCKISGGTKAIIIPDTVELEGSIRCLHSGDEGVRQRFRELAESVCRAHRCRCEIGFQCGNTMLNNDPAMTLLAMAAAERTVGREHLVTQGVSVLLGDDFAEFSRRIPGVYYFVGTADAGKKTDEEHHSARFQIDEDSLGIGVEMQLRLVFEFLK